VGVKGGDWEPGETRSQRGQEARGRDRVWARFRNLETEMSE